MPTGSHRCEISSDGGGALIVVKIASINFLEPGAELGKEEPVPGALAKTEPEAPPPPKPEPKLAAPSPEPKPAPAATPATEPTAAPEPAAAPGAEPGAIPGSAPKTDTDASDSDGALGSEVIQLGGADPSVAGAVRSLAKTTKERYDALGRTGSFHRVAIPYFEAVGAAAQEHNLGRLVAELLAVELGHTDPFVVVERERMNQVMKEHRLADLGIVDNNTAARLGKVLGAESIMSGTVTEAGPQFLVTVRQVDVESGEVLVSGQVAIDRAGLVALSSDAVVMRSKTGALFRSVIVPGWGQIYDDQSVKGAAFLVAGIGTIGAGFGALA